MHYFYYICSEFKYILPLIINSSLKFEYMATRP